MKEMRKTMLKQTGSHRLNWMLYLTPVLIVVSLGAILQMIVLPDIYKGITEWGRLLHLGIWAALMLPMAAYAKRYILMLMIYVAIFVSVGYLPFFVGMNVGGGEIASAYLFGTSWFLFWTWIYRAARSTNAKPLRRFVSGLSYAALTVPTLMPLLVWGYWVISGGYVLSSAIVLTLFQTNLSESAAYLKNQNIFLWLCGLSALFATLIGVVKILRTTLHINMEMPGRYWCFLWMVFMIVGIFSVNRDLSVYLPVRIAVEVQSALQDYRSYREARTMREERLKELQGLNITSSGGVFVLVIGESETRNHMQVYGYDRETTPWLQGQRENNENITFFNAYSNHTHTVPVLTYALSEKNQYNEMELKNAYSLLEAANAAGYETYWISNQRKFSAWDTPVAEIGSTAQHQAWMNGRSGVGTDTDHYDDILLPQIPTQCAKNTLIIIHLMGCHGTYRDRYPNPYFSGHGTTVDEYDDSVRYNDYILSQIYERVHALPNFKGMIYFSDHGDDADRNLGHEASKFTWPMARIPLMMWFSEDFQVERPQTFAQLKSRAQEYWTNDLLYNVMIDILGIDGMPRTDLQHDLASQEYHMTKENATTLHGTMRLADEDSAAAK